MKYVLILSLLLTGCSTFVPVNQKFPDVPKELMVKCQDLNLVPDGETKLSGVLSVVSSNYALYHECSARNDSWIEWYKTQKKIYESSE